MATVREDIKKAVARGELPESALDIDVAYEIDSDDLWPRDELHRYRLYFLKDEELSVAIAAPTMEGIGGAIQALHEDEKRVGLTLSARGRLGVMDTCPGGIPSEVGEWIVVPFGHAGHL